MDADAKKLREEFIAVSLALLEKYSAEQARLRAQNRFFGVEYKSKEIFRAIWRRKQSITDAAIAAAAVVAAVGFVLYFKLVA